MLKKLFFYKVENHKRSFLMGNFVCKGRGSVARKGLQSDTHRLTDTVKKRKAVLSSILLGGLFIAK